MLFRHAGLREGRPRLLFLPVFLLVVPVLAGCSLERLAVRTLGDALAESSSVYARDDDPELVGAALPFTLKTLETILETDPENEATLLQTCQGFTQYAYGWAELEAARVKNEEYAEYQRQRDRALRLYLRAKRYCLRALELRFPVASEALVRDPGAALERAEEGDIPLLYWTAAAWGAAINLGTHRPDLLVDLPVVRALVERCLELEPAWNRGSVHEAAMLLYALPATMGGDLETARHHYERAVELHGGTRASTYVSWAATVSVREQDREEFRKMLQTALDVDADAVPSQTLANRLAQRRARQLLDDIDEYFLPPLDEGDGADAQDSTP